MQNFYYLCIFLALLSLQSSSSLNLRGPSVNHSKTITDGVSLSTDKKNEKKLSLKLQKEASDKQLGSSLSKNSNSYASNGTNYHTERDTVEESLVEGRDVGGKLAINFFSWWRPKPKDQVPAQKVDSTSNSSQSSKEGENKTEKTTNAFVYNDVVETTVGGIHKDGKNYHAPKFRPNGAPVNHKVITADTEKEFARQKTFLMNQKENCSDRVRSTRMLSFNPDKSREFHLMHGLYLGNPHAMNEAMKKVQQQMKSLESEFEQRAGPSQIQALNLEDDPKMVNVTCLKKPVGFRKRKTQQSLMSSANDIDAFPNSSGSNEIGKQLESIEKYTKILTDLQDQTQVREKKLKEIEEKFKRENDLFNEKQLQNLNQLKLVESRLKDDMEVQNHLPFTNNAARENVLDKFIQNAVPSASESANLDSFKILVEPYNVEEVKSSFSLQNSPKEYDGLTLRDNVLNSPDMFIIHQNETIDPDQQKLFNTKKNSLMYTNSYTISSSPHDKRSNTNVKELKRGSVLGIGYHSPNKMNPLEPTNQHFRMKRKSPVQSTSSNNYLSRMLKRNKSDADDMSNHFSILESQLACLTNECSNSNLTSGNDFGAKFKSLHNDLLELEKCVLNQTTRSKPHSKSSDNGTLTVQVRVSVDLINATNTTNSRAVSCTQTTSTQPSLENRSSWKIFKRNLLQCTTSGSDKERKESKKTEVGVPSILRDRK